MKNKNAGLKKFRQGDLLIEEINLKDYNLEGFSRQKAVNERLIVMRGEATGHHHSILAKEADFYQDANGVMLVIPNVFTSLVHQEHRSIPIERPVQITRQREYTSEREMWVKD